MHTHSLVDRAPSATVFLSRKLFLNYFTCCIRAHVVYLRLLGVSLLSLLKLTRDNFQSRETVTGEPQLLAVGSIDRYLPVRMCRFTAVTGTIITKLALIQQVNFNSLTHWIFNLRKPLYYTTQQANLSPPCPAFVAL